jgi:hypothetical protein
VNYPTGKGTTSIYPADFNGDGITDLAAANSGSTSPGLVVEDSTSSGPSSVSILMGNGDGTFQHAVNYSTGDGGNGVVSTILTPNGFQDLAVCFFGSYVTVLLGNGNGTFGAGANSPTTTTLTSSLNPSALNQSVTYTATVSPSTATGTVTFSHGSTVMGTGTLSKGTATLVYSALSAGGHDLTASYGGDANDAPSVSPVLVQVVD